MGDNVDGKMYNGAPINMGAVNDWAQGQQANYDNKLAGMRSSGRQQGNLPQVYYDQYGMTQGQNNLPPESQANRQQAAHQRNQEMFRTQSGQGQNLQAERMPQARGNAPRQPMSVPRGTGTTTSYQPQERISTETQIEEPLQAPMLQSNAPSRADGGWQSQIANQLRGRRGRR
jgi:hypothetical protein